jgi:hypothetical protein
MRKQLMMALGIALCFGSTARANPHVSSQLLGWVDGIVSYCVYIDPRDERAYFKLRQKVIAGVTNSELETARGSAEYRAVYKLMYGIFHEMPHNDALRLCKAAIN